MKIPYSIPAQSFRFKLIDLLILLFIVGALSLIIYVASGWSHEMQPAVDIRLDPKYIPQYSANSLIRIFIAYILSLLFSIWYGYLANRSRIHEKVMIPLLFIDILENHFTPDEAWNQLETAIDWGRYTELFAYDYDSGELYLE